MSELEMIRQAPKALLHDHLDGGLRPATVIELAARDRATASLPTADPDELGRLVPARRRPQEPRAVPRGVRATPWRCSRRGTRSSGSPPSAPRTWRPTASSTPRCATRPSCRPEGGLTLDEVVTAILDGFRRGSAAAAAGRPIVMRLLVTAMRQAARSVEIAELRRPLARRRASSASTSPGPEAGYPADAPPRRLPPDPARELPRHDPRRRGLRAALDLGGAPVVRRRAARPRRPDRRRHHGPAGRLARARPARRARARPARPARDVPDLERPHRRGGVDRRAPDRPAAPAALPGHGQHRQPADERRDAVVRVRRRSTQAFGIGLDEMEWLTTQRDEERLRAVRRAAAADQRGRSSRATRGCARARHACSAARPRRPPDR